MPRKKGVGDGGSAAQKRAHGALPDAVRATKKSSTPVASGTTGEKGAADTDKATTNRNLAQGKESDAVRTATSYFDPVWNAFSKHTDGSMQWIPKQIVAMGEDFHSQVGEGKVRELLCTKFVGKDTTRRTTPGSPSHIYRDMLPWSKSSRNHMPKMLRNCLLTACVRLKRRQNTMPLTLRIILYCP